MTYHIIFQKTALKEWARLDHSVKERLQKKLQKRLLNPEVDSARLSGDLSGYFKLKDNEAGIRLVYRVDKGKLIVFVIAVGSRANDEVYLAAIARNND